MFFIVIYYVGIGEEYKLFLNNGGMRMINQVIIDGFKSIRGATVSLSRLNVVVGANGAGKSNFIEIFRLLLWMVNGSFSRYIQERGGADVFPFNGIKCTPKIEIGFSFHGEGGGEQEGNEYAFRLTPTVDERFLISESRRYKDFHWRSYGHPSYESRIGEFKSELAIDGRCFGVGYYIYKAISNWQVYHFHDTTNTAAMRRTSLIDDFKKLRSDASNIAAFLYHLKHSTSGRVYYNQIVDAIRIVLPFFEDFTLDCVQMGEDEKVKLSWKQKGSDYPMQAHHLSDGSIRFVCLATALLQPMPPSTIVIDEPELGLHPEAIRVLASLVKKAAERTQVIVATQSPLFLDQFAIEDILVARRKDGASYFERLKEEDYLHWLDDYSVGELWEKNVIMGGVSHE